MRRALILLMLALCPAVAAAQDGAGVARLEEQIRQLQREVLNLSQLVNELRARVDRPSPATLPSTVVVPSASSGARSAAPDNAASTRWIDATRWQSVRQGQSELEVLEILGPPTSMRGQGEERVLLYALEIGTSGFLAGSVTLRDRVVVSIETPRLK